MRIWNIRRGARVALLILAALLWSACGAVQQRPTEEQGQCLILSTNDSEANFDGERLSMRPQVRYQGTIARVAQLKREMSTAHPGAVLLVSIGDVLQGRYVYRRDGDRNRASRDIWRLYEKSGYDLAVLGNHDFDGGPAVTRYSLQGLKTLRFVVSNLDHTSPTLNNEDGKLYSDVEVRRCGGLKVGFLGLLTPSTVRISKFGDTRFSHPNDPIYPAARAAVTELKRRGVDLIVVLSHLGLEEDKRLAQKVQGIDAIIGGHSHTTMRAWHFEGLTAIVQAGARFHYVGHLNLASKKGGGLDFKRSSWALVPVDKEMKANPTIEAAVDTLREGYLQEKVIGQRAQAWILRGPAKQIYATRVAREMMRAAAATGRATQMAMVNKGGLRTSKIYPTGPVTNLEVSSIHPFGNRLVHVSLNGAQLKTVMEHVCGASKRHRGRGRRVGLFGVSLRCDPSRRSISYKRVASKTVAITFPGERVLNLKIAGKPVDPKAQYGMAVNDYLARGGSGFFPLELTKRTCLNGEAFGPQGCESGPTLADVIMTAVKADRFDKPLNQP